MRNREGEPEATLVGCFTAQLDPTTGRCSRFRQYSFEAKEHLSPFKGWSE